jgi:hypothetical protein
VNPKTVVAPLLLALSLLALAGCAARPAPDFRGRWQPVNRYSETTQEIPLRQAYMFHPAPMDRTLRTMLARWMRDSKMLLVYEHPSDYTLHAPVARIRTNDLQDALDQLNAIYAPQQVSMVLADNRVVVRQTGASVQRSE